MKISPMDIQRQTFARALPRLRPRRGPHLPEPRGRGGGGAAARARQPRPGGRRTCRRLLDEHRQRETILKNTLLTAQRVSEEIRRTRASRPRAWSRKPSCRRTACSSWPRRRAHEVERGILDLRAHRTALRTDIRAFITRLDPPPRPAGGGRARGQPPLPEAARGGRSRPRPAAMPELREADGGVTLRVRVQPRASRGRARRRAGGRPGGAAHRAARGGRGQRGAGPVPRPRRSACPPRAVARACAARTGRDKLRAASRACAADVRARLGCLAEARRDRGRLRRAQRRARWPPWPGPRPRVGRRAARPRACASTAALAARDGRIVWVGPGPRAATRRSRRRRARPSLDARRRRRACPASWTRTRTSPSRATATTRSARRLAGATYQRDRGRGRRHRAHAWRPRARPRATTLAAARRARASTRCCSAAPPPPR